jgi:hypothetical protein
MSESAKTALTVPLNDAIKIPSSYRTLAHGPARLPAL